MSSDFDTAVVVAGALGEIGLVSGRQGRHRLSVRTRPKPRALLRTDHSRPNGIGDPQPQMHFTQVIEHFDRNPVVQTTRGRILKVHLEDRHAAIGGEAAEGGSDPLIGGGCD